MAATHRRDRRPGRLIAALAIAFGVGAGIGGVVGASLAPSAPEAAAPPATAVREGCADVVASFEQLLAARRDAYAALAATPVRAPDGAAPEAGGDADEDGTSPGVAERRARTIRLVGAANRLRQFTERHRDCLSEQQRRAVAALPPAPPGAVGDEDGPVQPVPPLLPPELSP